MKKKHKEIISNMKFNAIKKAAALMLACCMTASALAGCGGSGSTSGSETTAAATTAADVQTQASTEAASSASTEAASAESTAAGPDLSSAPEIPGLTCQSIMDLVYAECFNVYFYNDDYALIDIKDEGQFLLVPAGASVPEGLSKDITVIQKDIKNIYLAATASMALFSSMNALDVVTMTSLNENGWSFDEPKKLLASGAMSYAGKYSEPDYEMLLGNGCDLVIESTMIYHTPEVLEMIQDLGMPVIIDRSSYESNPLGRTEWIKLYSVIVDHQEDAETFFNTQLTTLKELEDFPNTEKTVAFFYFTTDGKVVVRSSSDYVPSMIEMGGGRYIFKGVTDSSGSVSVGLTLEKFYDMAKEADYIVYNGSIDSAVKNLDSLIAKSDLLKEFKAYKDGNCWLSTGAMYQRTDLAADMIMDFHKLVTDDTGDMHFLKKLE